MCAPVLAGEGVINGFRGEQRHGAKCIQMYANVFNLLFKFKSFFHEKRRRIEDKLNAMQMEAKAVQILFDTSSLQGNRIFGLAKCAFRC